MNLVIKQNTQQELVPTAVLDKLYALTYSNAQQGVVAPAYPSADEITGSIVVPAAYQDTVDYLNERFPNLIITVQNNNYYMRFADPEVVRILIANNIGDEVGITSSNAASASIGELFKNNTDITSFDEFRYFTAQNASSSPRASFLGCTSLERIDISNCTACPVFNGCTALKYFNGPASQEGVLNLGNIIGPPSYAFNNCTGITEIVINNPISTGSNSFNGASNIVKVSAPDWDTLFNCSFAVNGYPWNQNVKIYINGIESTTATVPSDLTKIKDYAFASVKSITSVVFSGTSLTEIGYNSFNSCKGLLSIAIPEGVTKIGAQAFRSCEAMTTVELPSTITSIGDNAFNSCKALTSFTIKASSPMTINSNVLNNTNNCPIYVPAASVSTYQSASGWSSYASRILAIST